MSNELEKQQDALPWMTTKYGLVFTGLDPVTPEEVDTAKNYFGQHMDNPADFDNFDRLSFVGRLHRKYTAQIWIRNETFTQKLGGEGSHTYETQQVCDPYVVPNDTVEFKDEDQREGWHINPDGDRTYGVVDYPRTGRAYHVDLWGQTVAGPMPGTAAEEMLGDGGYVWDEDNAWWLVATEQSGE